MVVGILELELSIPGADSLKAKRMVIRSLKDRIRKNFNVSIAEVGGNDQWQSATLAIAHVGTDRQFANRALSKIVDFTERDRDLLLDDYRLGWF